ncbi:carbohydrate ABC transporter permease [Rhizobium etli]|uniref:carbohydrate ABC transporter permease n=1 Tax=Rhizobium etli TaxID=29449 RepID=UPI0003839A7C|nr:carbohydrate ABC transporter permease [Rhizobium etli]AGS25226.1 ABC transporter permease protein [Rhizobium etli bv. mimosae str. Mim1]
MTRLFSFTVTACIGLLYGIPLLLILAIALKPEAEIFKFGTELSVYSIFPQKPTLAAFQDALGRPNFLQQVVNTFVVGIIQSTTTIVLCLMAAYVISRSKSKWGHVMTFSIALVLFVPYQTIVVPLFLIIRDFGMLNSWFGLILPWIASPMTVVMLKNALDEFPVEIDEAARVDRAGPIRTLFQIVAPNIVPSLATVWVINMVGIYDSLLWPLVSITEPSNQVAQVGLAALFSTWERPSFATAFAASLIVVAPLLPLFILFQRQFAATFASAGMK